MLVMGTENQRALGNHMVEAALVQWIDNSPMNSPVVREKAKSVRFTTLYSCNVN